MNMELHERMRSHGYEELYFRQGGFTVCVLQDDTMEIVGVGVAKRTTYQKRADRDVLELGREIALARAVKDLNPGGLPVSGHAFLVQEAESRMAEMMRRG